MEYRQNTDWSEDEHPRDGDGKFTNKGAQERFNARQAEYERQTRKWTAEKRNTVDKNALSAKEWATFYKKIAEIKTGGYVERLKNGDCVMQLGGKTIIFDANYVNPKVFKIINNTDLDYVDSMENEK